MFKIWKKDSSQKVTNICCIGAGYVGGPTCSMIAYKCPDITVNVVDKMSKRIDQWNSDKLPIFEVTLFQWYKSCHLVIYYLNNGKTTKLRSLVSSYLIEFSHREDWLFCV